MHKGPDPHLDPKRRQLLKTLGLTSMMAAGSVSLPWPLRMAMAQAQNDYKGVICVFLNGGNDGNDTLVPMGGGYEDYRRAHDPIALAKEDLVPLKLSNADQPLGLNPALAKLKPISDRGDIAWVANAGPLVQPVSAMDVRAELAEVPSFLGSHPDQQRLVSGGVPGTFAARSGWGGRAIEQMPQELLSDLLSNLTLSQRDWLMRGEFWSPTLAQDRERYAAMDLRDVLAGADTDELRAYQSAVRVRPSHDDLSVAYRHAVGNVLDEVLELRRVLDVVPEGLAPRDFQEPDDNGLMEQLRTATRVFWAGREAGVKRQMVFVDWGGFDTHSNQRGADMDNQDGLLQALSNGLADLDEQLAQGGLQDQVVTMVMSEFGRPLRPNSNGGTDHGWGNHFWIMGGPVNGNKVYGQMPSLIPGGPDDMGEDALGRWVPTTSTEQIAASVMEWFGLPRSAFPKVFAHLQNFPKQTLDMF
ncbi:MAG: DUF1501 domain-containing protein [Wenzhouxiangella sp.]|nr:DUF1501 domain-containing protein [Wenzhouxiangella sp.]MDR9453895.1 DUF1501 domain-containing protein [Wenzhouxiangella sp.]